MLNSTDLQSFLFFYSVWMVDDITVSMFVCQIYVVFRSLGPLISALSNCMFKFMNLLEMNVITVTLVSSLIQVA